MLLSFPFPYPVAASDLQKTGTSKRNRLEFPAKTNRALFLQHYYSVQSTVKTQGIAPYCPDRKLEAGGCCRAASRGNANRNNVGEEDGDGDGEDHHHRDAGDGDYNTATNDDSRPPPSPTVCPVSEMENEGQSYTLDEALASVGFGKFQILVLFYAGFGWFAEAMEIMILSFVGPVVKVEWGLSAGQESLLTTVVFAGMLLGAYTWGIISDKCGRRKGFFSITMITSGAGLISSFSPNFLSLAILRCLVGFGLGGGHVFLSWFLEFVPASHRGMWMVVFTTFWTVGTVFEALLAWAVLPNLNWRWLLGFSVIPSFCLLLLYGIAPESPRYLCMKGRTMEARHILQNMAELNRTKLPSGTLVSNTRIEVDEESAPSEHQPLISAAKKQIMEFKSSFSSLFMLFSPKLFRTTILLWIIFFGNTFAYYGIILLTSELSHGEGRCGMSLLHAEGQMDDGNSLYIDVLITSFAELPGLLLSALIVDRFGRKISMAVMFFMAWLFLIPLVSHQAPLVTTGLLFGARMCALGSFTVACVYAPELYPTSVRATGAGASNAVGRIGGMLCPLVAVGLVTSCQLKEAIILFEIVIAISVGCILFFPFDTTGKELSDNVAVGSDPKKAVQDET